MAWKGLLVLLSSIILNIFYASHNQCLFLFAEQFLAGILGLCALHLLKSRMFELVFHMMAYRKENCFIINLYDRMAVELGIKSLRG